VKFLAITTITAHFALSQGTKTSCLAVELLMQHLWRNFRPGWSDFNTTSETYPALSLYAGLFYRWARFSSYKYFYQRIFVCHQVPAVLHNASTSLCSAKVSGHSFPVYVHYETASSFISTLC